MLGKKLISMKMKNNFNISDMNMEVFSFKNISVFFLTFLLTVVSVSAETKQKNTDKLISVVGFVRDAHTRQPIAAAQITVPDEKISVVSDDKGKFKLKVESLSDVITINAYDYNQTQIALKGRDSLVVDLYSTQFSNYFKNIEDVTGTVNNSALVSSGKSVDDLSRSTAISADEAIQTALGGDVRAVSRSAVAGMGSSLFIRGINSLNANAQPLFVVDGVIWNNLYDVQSVHPGFFSNPLDNMDVSDIESISVIKDGSSIYGSKASNGVIIIKTKRATEMATKINVNFFTGTTTQPGSLPMMQGEDFRLYASDLLKSQGLVTGNDVSGYGFLTTDRTLLKAYNVNHNITNWANETYRNGSTSNYVINVTGGDEKALYYLSLGYTDNKGVVKNTDMQRINFRLNGDLKLFEAFKFAFNVGFTRVERTLLDDGVEYTSPSWISAVKSPFLSPYTFTSQGSITTDYANSDQFSISNPVGVINRSANSLKKFRFNLGAVPSYQFTPELSLSSQFDYSLDKTVEGRFVPMLYTPAVNLEGYGTSLNEVNSQVMRNIGIFDDTRLTYVKKIDTFNHLKAILGWRYLNNFYESDYAEEHNTGSNSNTTITGSYKYLQVRGINNYTNSLSNYLNVAYDYNNRYFVTGVISADNSSKFGTETQGSFSLFGRSWAVFPSVNASWILSSENFMRDVNFINFLKIKAGYGVTGNDGLVDYQSMAYFTSVKFMDKANGLVLTNLSNPAIQWETTAKVNAGFDMNLFKDRLSISLDCYASNTSNMLFVKQLPIVSGLGMYWTNGGNMQNNGFELTANWKVLNFKHWRWELGASVGHYTNIITTLPVESYTTSVYGGEVLTAVGQSAGVFYGYKTNGVFASETQAATDHTNPTTGVKGYLQKRNDDGTTTNFGAGDMRFVDVNNDGVIDEKDKQVIGNPNPLAYGTISNKLTYDRFTLNTVFTYSFGNQVYNYKRQMLESGTDFSNQTTAMLRRWTADGQITDQPKAVYGDPMGNARFSDRWIEDGSYIKLKTISLSYDVPIKSNFIEGFNIWISANNLLTLTRYLGTDPEFSAGNSVYYQGIDAGLLPQTKSYYVGIKFNL